MKIGNTHVTGSLGALPVWSDMAGAVLSLEGAGDRLDPVDLTFNGLGLRYPETGQLFVPVDPGDGGRIVPGRGARHALVAPDIPVILSYGNVSRAAISSRPAGSGHSGTTRSNGIRTESGRHGTTWFDDS
jgi:hypothetical protein